LKDWDETKDWDTGMPDDDDLDTGMPDEDDTNGVAWP